MKPHIEGIQKLYSFFFFFHRFPLYNHCICVLAWENSSQGQVFLLHIVLKTTSFPGLKYVTQPDIMI